LEKNKQDKDKNPSCRQKKPSKKSTQITQEDPLTLTRLAEDGGKKTADKKKRKSKK